MDFISPSLALSSTPRTAPFVCSFLLEGIDLVISSEFLLISRCDARGLAVAPSTGHHFLHPRHSSISSPVIPFSLSSIIAIEPSVCVDWSPTLLPPRRSLSSHLRCIAIASVHAFYTTLVIQLVLVGLPRTSCFNQHLLHTEPFGLPIVLTLAILADSQASSP